MTIEIGIIISLVSIIITAVSFIIAQKKSSKDDGMEMGKFMGMIKTEIANIKDMITELKNDHKEVDEKIKDGILEHEKRFHSK